MAPVNDDVEKIVHRLLVSSNNNVLYSDDRRAKQKARVNEERRQTGRDDYSRNFWQIDEGSRRCGGCSRSFLTGHEKHPGWR